MDYETFIANKEREQTFTGLPYETPDERLFPFQADLTRYALNRGRAAIFADTGLGKSRMEAEWASQVSGEGRVLVLTPLAVAQQWVQEAEKIDVEAVYLREDDADRRIVVTNYDLLHKFDLSRFTGIVLDESSILKSFNGATRNAIIEGSQDIPYRLACTATPAPNDFTELGNHSEFLGVQSRVEMLAEYFVHDGGSTQDWRLKGHAEQAFWRWVCSWGAIVRKPSDLGYDDGAYALPPLTWHEHVVEVDHADYHGDGFLFAPQATTLNAQRATRRATRSERVRRAGEIAAAIRAEGRPVLVWCELNDEADGVEDIIPGAVQVAGSDDAEVKTERLLGFASGKYQAMVSKSSIAGFGLNWQQCSDMIFVGASHSYEQTYQAIRRCWRFGQTREVNVHVIRAATEQAIVENYRRKETDAARLGAETQKYVSDYVMAGVRGGRREWNLYNPSVPMSVPAWLR
jgi:superfamily II DNA or RNA helicase